MKKKSFEIIMPFDSHEFIEMWEMWIQFRADIKKPYKSDLSIQAQFKKLSKYPESVAIEMIEQSIANGWQGIFEVRQNGNNKPGKAEKFMDEAAKGRELLKQMQQNDKYNNH